MRNGRLCTRGGRSVPRGITAWCGVTRKYRRQRHFQHLGLSGPGVSEAPGADHQPPGEPGSGFPPLPETVAGGADSPGDQASPGAGTAVGVGAGEHLTAAGVGPAGGEPLALPGGGGTAGADRLLGSGAPAKSGTAAAGAGPGRISPRGSAGRANLGKNAR